MNRPRPSAVAMWVAIVITAIAMVALFVRFIQLADESAELRGDLRSAEAQRNSLARSANALEHQIRTLGERPVTTVPSPAALPDLTEFDDPETQQRELQERERQQAERQERERQQRERQQREADQPERQQDEVQQDEIQDEEADDPEIQQDEDQEAEVQEDEIQNEEVDDPDPNSALTFAVEDNCNPADGDFVTDVGASWRRADGTLTLVLTCTTAPVPPPGQEP